VRLLSPASTFLASAALIATFLSPKGQKSKTGLALKDSLGNLTNESRAIQPREKQSTLYSKAASRLNN
jgi:hypothetical protein